MIETTWSITIGPDNEDAPPTPQRAWAELLEDYAVFRGKGRSRRRSLRQALAIMMLSRKPIRGGSNST